MRHRHSPTDVFLAIADPTRRALLDRLLSGEHTARALAEPFNVTLSAVSQHLGILRAVGLVSVRRVGRERIYHLEPEPLKRVFDWLSYYQNFWQSKLDALGKYLADNP
jgi:DNA-binding transcriptional ArsR family regulator